MSSDYQNSNPYASSAYNPQALAANVLPDRYRPEREKAPGSLLLPAMALILVSGIGLLFSGFNFAMSFGDPIVDHSAPPMVQEFQRGTVGPIATGMQGGFIMLNLFIIVCGVQMMKLQSWGLAVTGSVLSMLNIGSCCCILGLPVGIWSLAVLMSPEIISIFTAANQQQQG